MLCGYCEMVYTKEGKIYLGNAFKDKKEGFGIYITLNPKRIYIGFWMHNKQEGLGKLINEKSSKYGFWNEGERLKWYDNFNEAISTLSIQTEKFTRFFKMEIKEVNKYLKTLSII